MYGNVKKDSFVPFMMLLTKPIKVKTLFKQKPYNAQSFIIKILSLEKLDCWKKIGNLDYIF